jgi:hypothetical protein
MNTNTQGVACQCGQMPELASIDNLEGCGNTMHYRLECPYCGGKKAEWRRSPMVAIQEWETHFFKLKS